MTAINFTFVKQVINELQVYENIRNLYKSSSCLTEESFPRHWHNDAVTLAPTMTEVMGDHFVIVTATTATFALIINSLLLWEQQQKRPEKYWAPDRDLYSWLLSELQKKSQTAFSMDEISQIVGSERWLCLA